MTIWKLALIWLFKIIDNNIDIYIDAEELEKYKIVDGMIVEKTEEELHPPIEEPDISIITNEELKNEIEELKQIIDIMLGGIDDGI